MHTQLAIVAIPCPLPSATTTRVERQKHESSIQTAQTKHTVHLHTDTAAPLLRALLKVHSSHAYGSDPACDSRRCRFSLYLLAFV
jgi:hypothetical protein